MPDIAPPFDKTNTFIALCWARAQLYAAGTIGLHDAVDSLQEWAVEKGLVAEIGQDEVQLIMAREFARARTDLGGWVP